MTGRNPHERDLAAKGLLDYHDGVAAVLCDDALPPGSRVRLVLSPDLGAPPPSGKISGMRRSPDGTMVVTVRLNSLSREQRDALERVAKGAGTPKGE